ncbi:Ankyrin repeat family protein [Melia azedarach]|uniref:Ankyrin repeat family protein n=1 Tax=Melia azedarach TaxID=155640 RepID=A0ACC1WT81_MELAZ|nr:Ankyrin repeat family protein [Melia azedarach]
MEGSESQLSHMDKIMERFMEKQERLIEQQERVIGLIEQIIPKREDDGATSSPIDELLSGNARSDSTHGLSEDGISDEQRKRRLRLYRAALNGDWAEAKSIYHDCKESIGVEISGKGHTALHIAVGAKRIGFVKELVKIMNENDLEKRNNDGSTALHFAAASGKVKLAQEIMENDKAIAMIPDNFGTLPIDMAASLGHKDMVKYLYQATRYSLSEEHRKDLFVNLIETDMYDVALKLLDEYPDVAIARAGNYETALHVIARKDLRFSKLGSQNMEGILSGCFILGAKDKRLMQALELVERIWKRVILLSDLEISQLIAEPGKLIFDAAERGNVEFLSILIREYPDLIWKVDNPKNKYSIFHIAVKYRQMDVFKLIYEIGSSKEMLLMQKDQEGNNILHLAGLSVAHHELDTISGHALQMQQELLWFKEVENVVPSRFAKARNRKGLTPRALFTKEHEGLRKNGEKWMKNIATSCMLVATLIATVVFEANLMKPNDTKKDEGSDKEDDGGSNLVFDYGAPMIIFYISNVISLVSSSACIVNFLSILTSPFAEEEFRWSLPRKLRIGLLLLFLSVFAMMVVLSVSFYSLFNAKRLWVFVLATVMAAIPIVMFILQQFRLLSSVLLSSSTFSQGKTSLFRKEGETTDQQRGMANACNAHLKIQCP